VDRCRGNRVAVCIEKTSMANFHYLTPNQLRRRARQSRTWMVCAGIPTVVLIGFILHPFFTLPGTVALIHLWHRQGRLLAGARGEDRALGHPQHFPGSLADLSDEFCVFNQLILPVGTGLRELDAVVVGPTGVFVVEVKHCRGVIEGNETDAVWRQRIPLGAKHQVKAMRNAARQAATAAGHLGRYLRAQGTPVRVRPVTVFTHPRAQLAVACRTVPVLPLLDLAGHIREQRLAAPFAHQKAVIRRLPALRDGAVRNDSPGTGPQPRVSFGPRPIGWFMRDFVTRRVEAIMQHNYQVAAIEAARWATRGCDPRDSSQHTGPTASSQGDQRPYRTTNPAPSLAHRLRRRTRILERCVEIEED
jgi:hypothetical protein